MRVPAVCSLCSSKQFYPRPNSLPLHCWQPVIKRACGLCELHYKSDQYGSVTRCASPPQDHPWAGLGHFRLTYFGGGGDRLFLASPVKTGPEPWVDRSASFSPVLNPENPDKNKRIKDLRIWWLAGGYETKKNAQSVFLMMS